MAGQCKNPVPFHKRCIDNCFHDDTKVCCKLVDGTQECRLPKDCPSLGKCRALISEVLIRNNTLLISTTFYIFFSLLEGNTPDNECNEKDCGDPCEKRIDIQKASVIEKGRCNSKGVCQTLSNVALGCEKNSTGELL